MAEKDENDGYKFAIAFLAASGSIFYATYNYLQNTPIREVSFGVLCLMLVFMLISIICFLTYILVKEYLIGTKNNDIGKILNKLAQVLYEIALGIFAFSVIYFICIFLCIISYSFFAGLLREIEVEFIVLSYVVLFLSIITFLLVVYYRGAHRSWSRFFHLFSNSVLKNAWMLRIGLGSIVVTVLFFGITSYTPLHGHVTIDMESVYYMTFGYPDFAANLTETKHLHAESYSVSIRIADIHCVQYTKTFVKFIH